MPADMLNMLADRLDPQPTDLEQAGWHTWLHTLFPSYTHAPFADHHQQLWDWIWALEPGVRPAPLVCIWPRGGAKSTSAELGTVAAGARRARRYVLYVCDTQDQADDHVANIGTLLEAGSLADHYPQLGRRMLSKYGHSRGWRRNRLRTAAGFTVDALGLDTAARGVKLDEQRPDLLVIDDIDSETDSPAQVDRKIGTLTRKLLPAGSDDLAVLAIQNLVHENSVFAQLASGDADFLNDRHVSGPVPAVENLVVEQRPHPDEPDRQRWTIIEGEATWAGQPLSVCQANIDDWGLTAFLKEAQHDTTPPAGGMFDHLDWTGIRCGWDDVPWQHLVRTVVWVDPAVTSTDDSDAMGIQADALAEDGTIYRLYSWEDRTTPLDALTRAVLKACELQAEHVGVETDQGGDTWLSVWHEAVEAARERLHEQVEQANGHGDKYQQQLQVLDRLGFTQAKAGAGIGSKQHRASQMLAEYERDRFRHVTGTHRVLEDALHRFPKSKPYDLTDAAFWSWWDLAGLHEDQWVVEATDLMAESDLRVAISPY